VAHAGRGDGHVHCNDRRWPETYRVMGLQGVEIHLARLQRPIENIHHRRARASAAVPSFAVIAGRRLPERGWVLASAKCGAEDGFAMNRRLGHVAPTGEIARRRDREDELITTTLDLELGEYLRRTVLISRSTAGPSIRG